MKRLSGKYLPLFISLAVILSGCQTAASTKEATATSKNDEQVTPGGELTFALSIALTNGILDPHRTSSPQNSRIMRSIFDSLIVELPDHTFKPWLATSWEISPDQKSYTFTLRQDVLFHDGTPFNAEAVKFNFERINTVEAPGVAKNNIGPFQSVEVLDPYKVRINFTKPFAPFLRNLSSENLGIVSPEAVKKYGDKFYNNPVGTGPFKFVKLTEGTEYVLQKNPAYNWAPANAKHQGPAYLDKLVFKVITEEATRVGVLQSGDVKAADIIPPPNMAAIKADPRFQVQEAELLNYNAAIHINNTKAPWDNVKLREALRLSLDIDKIVKTVYLGTFPRAWSSISPSIFGYDPSLEKKWKSDPAQAGQILDDLGWKKGADGIRVKDGKRLTVDMIDFYANRERRMDVMAIVQNQWKQAGIELKISSLSVGAYTERSNSGDYDIWIGSQYGADPDVYRVVNKNSRFKDPELDTLLDAGYAELDDAKRKDIYQKVQNLLFDKAYTIPIYVFPYSVASVKELKGLPFDAHGFPLFYDAWLKK
ncbi:hypothetical protein A8709_00110 [Paenibacillus pectinilyticus]|uniref:Solute-binding protein family 5 domain-containing protein n=2 Tax=Paenibacillus pectinilyticus TaxID=512399 RepID=A0A1C1A0R4_9BACL|nr:hypothetical protein A8709_00110 [Paenibacillus pectinilyticus]